MFSVQNVALWHLRRRAFASREKRGGEYCNCEREKRGRNGAETI